MNCPTCGAVLAPIDMQQPSCRYCGALHPHVARAAEKVEIVKQMMQPGPGGIPAAMQGMVAPWQGMMPSYGAPPQQPPPYMAPGTPPQYGGPVGNAGYVPPMYGAPDAARAVRRGMGVMLFVLIAIFVVIAMVGAGLAFWLIG